MTWPNVDDIRQFLKEAYEVRLEDVRHDPVRDVFSVRVEMSGRRMFAGNVEELAGELLDKGLEAAVRFQRERTRRALPRPRLSAGTHAYRGRR